MEFKLPDQAPQITAKFSIFKPTLAIHDLLLTTFHPDPTTSTSCSQERNPFSFNGKTPNT